MLGFDLLSGVGLTPGRTTEQEGHLTVGDGLLGKIVVDDESVLSIVPKPFTDRGLNDVLVRDEDGLKKHDFESVWGGY